MNKKIFNLTYYGEISVWKIYVSIQILTIEQVYYHEAEEFTHVWFKPINTFSHI